MTVRVPVPVLLATGFLALAAIVGAFAYGVATVRYKLALYEFIEIGDAAVRQAAQDTLGTQPWYYGSSERTQTIYISAAAPDFGLNLVTALGPENSLTLKVVDMQGEFVHDWAVDWFEIWPDAQHLPPESVPQAPPGTHLHGTLLLPNGDILFNFEKLGLVRMGLCGKVQWKLPYLTHHSIFQDYEGNLWIPGVKWNTEPLPDYPAHTVPVREQTILKVSVDGELLEEISVFDLLVKNDQRALLNMRASAWSNTVSGNSLHLNDIEVFPDTIEEGFFTKGDVVISLRNIHSVIVFDQATWKIKLLKVGGFTRQHDPDFVDGDTLMIFDNNTIGPASFGQQSRILLLDANTGELSVKYEGSPDNPFYTNIMGKQQLLESGHLLITDSISGRGFEIDEDGEIVWEYINLVAEGRVGIVEEIERLPESFRPVFENANCASL